MNLNRKNWVVKKTLVIGLVVMCVLLCSCNKGTKREPIDEGLMNAGLIDAFNDTAIENAIIAQHTLYSYHFIDNSSQLNELGMRDLAILSRHYKEYPGPLNISRDGVDEAIYQERITYVAGQLEKDGIDPAKITISDGMPGGRGMTASDVLQIREADQEVRKEVRQSAPDNYTGSGVTFGGGNR